MPDPRLVFEPVADWPPLAWLARCESRTGEVRVFHGPRVETADDWFAEAAWAGEWERGDLDATDVVAGSGGRRRPGAVTFVGAGSTVDRLHSLEDEAGAVVSNSLPCLLATVGGEVDPTDARHRTRVHTIVRGLARYERWLPTSAGPVQLTYFDNLRWADGRLQVVPKPGAGRTFGDFATYHRFLASSAAALLANAGARGRRHPLRPLGTLSSGYDSTAVTVLARQAGLQEALTITRGFSGPSLDGAAESDSGQAVAEALGLRCHALEPRAPGPMEAVPFFAANGSAEDTHYLAASDILPGRLLLTGYHGDVVWGKAAPDLGPSIVRTGRGGLSLTEYRLWAGFLHCPVPFWGVRSIAQIHALTRSAEMAPWDVGGAYSRPICRRIVEAAGVPRDGFARRKRASAAAPLSRRTFLDPDSCAHYLAWLRAERVRFRRAGRRPPSTSLWVDRTGMATARLVEAWTERVSWSIASRTGWSRLPHLPAVMALRTLTHAMETDGWIPGLRRYLFPWALAVATARYRRPGAPVRGRP